MVVTEFSLYSKTSRINSIISSLKIRKREEFIGVVRGTSFFPEVNLREILGLDETEYKNFVVFVEAMAKFGLERFRNLKFPKEGSFLSFRIIIRSKEGQKEVFLVKGEIEL